MSNERYRVTIQRIPPANQGCLIIIIAGTLFFAMLLGTAMAML